MAAAQSINYSEYLEFKAARTGEAEINIRTEFENYIRLGGFPVLHISDYSIESAYKIVYDIYSSAILRDTIQRTKIRDTELLERVVKFVFDNVGNKLYVQVAFKMQEKSRINREFKPLLEIKDNHTKYGVKMDEFWTDNIEGVKHVYIADFLMMEYWG